MVSGTGAACYWQASGPQSCTDGYDPLGRLIYEESDPGYGGGYESADLYYSQDWQVIEDERINCSASTIRSQYVWSLGFVDDMILRDRNADMLMNTGNYGKTGSGLEERMYALNDANFNTTALVGLNAGTWEPRERYIQDPYGSFTVLTGSWGSRSGTLYASRHLHQGGWYDTYTATFQFRNRVYSPTLGRWMQQDPMGYVDGMNLYAYVRSCPIGLRDPSGLVPAPNWEITVPEDTNSTSIWAEAAFYRDEAYNRAAYHWNLGGQPPAIPPWGTAVPKPSPDYIANQYWHELFKKWEGRAKALANDAHNTALLNWFQRHRDARYGDQSGSTSFMYDPYAKKTANGKDSYRIVRPLGVALMDSLIATTIGKSPPGSPDRGPGPEPGEGYPQPTPGPRPGSGIVRRPPPLPPPDPAGARTGGGVAAATWAVSFLDQLHNGVNELFVETWVCGSQAGFYVSGVPTDPDGQQAARVKSWIGFK
jgi:RHS repeat-associated protein